MKLSHKATVYIMTEVTKRLQKAMMEEKTTKQEYILDSECVVAKNLILALVWLVNKVFWLKSNWTEVLRVGPMHPDNANEVELIPACNLCSTVPEPGFDLEAQTEADTKKTTNKQRAQNVRNARCPMPATASSHGKVWLTYLVNRSSSRVWKLGQSPI